MRTSEDTLTLAIGVHGSDAPDVVAAIDSLEHASALWARYRDQNDLASSDGYKVAIYLGAHQIAYVSYNGRVWPGSSYVRGQNPIL